MSDPYRLAPGCTYVILDLETFSTADLRACGAWAYAESPATEVLCAVIEAAPGSAASAAATGAFDGMLPWIPENGPPSGPLAALLERIGTGRQRIAAWNIQFEYAIWLNILTPRHGWPPPPDPAFWTDVMAVASYFNLPRALERCGKALGLPDSLVKSATGQKAMRRLCLPHRPSRLDPRVRIRPGEEPAVFAELLAYCAQDVRATRCIANLLPQPELPPEERDIARLDLIVNARGLALDVEATRAALEIVTQRAELNRHRAAAASGGEITSLSQRDRLLGWFAAHGLVLADLRAQTVQAALTRLQERELAEPGSAADVAFRDDSDGDGDGGDVPAPSPDVVDMLVWRREAARSSVKKLDRALKVVSRDGRMRGLLAYYGASQTGRFAGRLFQPHNLIRSANIKTPDPWDTADLLHRLGAAVAPDATPDVEPFFDMAGENATEYVISAMRSLIIPRSGKILIAGDFSAIEARVVAWLAGCAPLLTAFRNGTDTYRLMAAAIFDTTPDRVTADQRQVGKATVLGCGFGMGAAKFHATALRSGISISPELAELCVSTYRSENRAICRLWYAAEAAARDALLNPGRRYAFGSGNCLSFTYHVRPRNCPVSFLALRLPSGRHLFYPKARLAAPSTSAPGDPPLPMDHPDRELVFENPLVGTNSTYGAKMVENATQAAARDLMVAAMRRVENDPRFELVLSVHDELIVEADPDVPAAALDELMTMPPDWTGGTLPIRSESRVLRRYRK